MARQSAVRQALQLIHRIVDELAAKNGWKSSDYRLYVWVKETDYTFSINLLLEARSFPGRDEFEQWDRVLNFLEDRLRDEPEVRRALHLVIQTFDQTAEGGTRAIREPLVPIEELISAAPAI
ncbi:unnamed protein product [Gemmataceae bacterium]|nr:unnamed protein product [Gemmataceae bacterium]VTT99873.1 unnamed protein product [Gemmataceae bacterium]